MSDDQRYYMRKDWEQLKAFNWVSTAEDFTGFAEAFPSPTQREAREEARLCLHKNGSNRVITQNGVSDQVAYRQCVLRDTPTGTAAAGQRLMGRADGTPPIAVSWPN